MRPLIHLYYFFLFLWQHSSFLTIILLFYSAQLLGRACLHPTLWRGDPLATSWQAFLAWLSHKPNVGLLVAGVSLLIGVSCTAKAYVDHLQVCWTNGKTLSFICHFFCSVFLSMWYPTRKLFRRCSSPSYLFFWLHFKCRCDAFINTHFFFIFYFSAQSLRHSFCVNNQLHSRLLAPRPLPRRTSNAPWAFVSCFCPCSWPPHMRLRCSSLRSVLDPFIHFKVWWEQMPVWEKKKSFIITCFEFAFCPSSLFFYTF